jgi:hypothetical protein
VCQCLFYLENDDYIDDDIPTEVAAAAMFQQEPATAPAAQESVGEAQTTAGLPPTVSLYALAGVRMENAMLLPVTVHGHRLVALLDSGSATNFINVDLFSRLWLATDPHPTLRVLVANGDRVLCQGVARNVALAICRYQQHGGTHIHR